MALMTLRGPAVEGKTARPLPLELEEITPEWLTQAISLKAPGAVVEKYEIVDIRRGFTTIIRLRLTLNEEAKKQGIPELMMLKGGFEPHSRTRARTYIMESIGYRDIWPNLGLRTPTCYFADAEPDRNQAIMLLEDLKARGVTFCNVWQPQTYEQVAKRLGALADAHARTWNSPDIKPGGKYHDITLANGVWLLREYMQEFGFLTPEGWQKWIDLPRGAAVSSKITNLEWSDKVAQYLAKLSTEITNCIVHGDVHQGNCYIDIDGEPGFFDSIPRREPPYFDLAYTIGCSLDVDDRRKYDNALVRHYWQELRRHGVDVSLDEVVYYYKIFLAQGYLYFIINDTYFQTESFNTVHTMRFGAAMMDQGTKDLLDAVM